MGRVAVDVGRARVQKSETLLLNFPTAPGSARDAPQPDRNASATVPQIFRGDSLLIPERP